MKIIAVFHIKGGVGKTATSVNLAYEAARDGVRTLLCDLDPQGSSSFYMRIRPKKKADAKALLKGGDHLDANIRGTDYENLDLLPAHLSYRALDLLLDRKKHPMRRLEKVLRPLEDQYDLVLLDCPPCLTLLAESVFRAADLVLVPVVPTTLSTQALEMLRTFFAEEGLDDRKLLPFFSMVEERKRLHREVIDALTEQSPGCLAGRIPYRSTIEQMGIHRQPVACFAPTSPAARAYEALWTEVRSHARRSA